MLVMRTHHGASVAFPGELGTPSYVRHMLDSTHSMIGLLINEGFVMPQLIVFQAVVAELVDAQR